MKKVTLESLSAIVTELQKKNEELEQKLATASTAGFPDTIGFANLSKTGKSWICNLEDLLKSGEKSCFIRQVSHNGKPTLVFKKFSTKAEPTEDSDSFPY